MLALNEHHLSLGEGTRSDRRDGCGDTKFSGKHALHPKSTLFTPAEKAALGLADAMAGDHKRAPYDEIFAELRKYYSEEQIVALGWKAGIWLGYGRLTHVLDVPAIG